MDIRSKQGYLLLCNSPGCKSRGSKLLLYAAVTNFCSFCCCKIPFVFCSFRGWAMDVLDGSQNNEEKRRKEREKECGFCNSYALNLANLPNLI